MSVRTLLLVIVLVPLALVGGAFALGRDIPMPHFGRDYVQTIELGGEDEGIALPSVMGEEDPDWPLVVIDAGHGGRDPGAVGEMPDGEVIREKDITLAIALALRDELLAEGGIRVALTRENDTIVPLADRPEIARQMSADLFVSIHADSAGDITDVGGASIYTLSTKASSEAAARFAERENNADRVNGIEVDGQSASVSAILVELAQQATQDDSADLAELVLREGEGALAFTVSPRRSADLVVLQAPDIPAILFESGFVTNQSDRARLTTPEGRLAYARVLARAIRIYFARRSGV